METANMKKPRKKRALLYLDEKNRINAHVRDKNMGEYKAKSTNITISGF